MRPMLLAPCFACGLAAAAAEPAPKLELPLTLVEARERALLHNENLNIQREEFVAAEAAIDGARGAYDPLLEIDAGWRRYTEATNSTFSGAPAGSLGTTSDGLEGRAAVRQLFKTGAVAELTTGVRRGVTNNEFALLSPSYDTRVALELRQPLLRGRAIDPARLELRVAAADRERSAAALRVEVEQTVATVENFYWRLVAARQGLGVRGDAVRLAEEQLHETEARIEGGAAPETEIAQPRAELERRRGELIEAQEIVQRAANVLKLVLLGDEESELWSRVIVPVDEIVIEPTPIDVEASLETALVERAEIEVELRALEARAAESEFRRDRAKPGLDAVAYYGRSGLAGTPNTDGAVPPGFTVTTPPDFEGEFGRSFGVLADGELDDASIGLAFTYPIRNRAARADAAIAESAERQAEAELARARKRVRVEVLDALALVESASQRLVTARAAREAAEVQLEAERERFVAGLSTNFLVLTRQNDLENARLDEIEAHVDHRTARTALERATGTLLDDRGIELASEDGTSAPSSTREGESR